MGVIYATSKRSGKTYSVSIAGNNPTPAEQAEINAYIDQAEGISTTPAPLVDSESGSGNLIDFGQGFASGFGRGFADIPGGLASLLAAGLSYVPGDQGEEEIEAFGQGVTNAARSGIDYLIGTPEDNVAGKSGQALGSLASFLVPYFGGAKAASLLGGGTKAMRTTGTVSSGTMGVALGVQNQADRTARILEEGGEVDNRELALIMGGAVGATEALPVGRVFGAVANILKKVPKDVKEEAVKTIGKRLKNAGVAGLAEGGQEVTAAILQDLIEQNLYNPDLELSLSAYQDDAIYGGGAGATFNFLLETVAGRRVKKVLKSRGQLLSDQREEGQEILDQVDRAKASTAGPEGVETPLLEAPRLQLTGPKTKPEEEAEINQTRVQSAQLAKDLADQDQVRNADEERLAQTDLQRQILAGGEMPIELSELPQDVAFFISNSRIRSGSDIDPSAPTTIAELEAVLPDLERKREIIQTIKHKQRPGLEPAYVSPEQRDEQAAKKKADQKVIDNLEAARVAVETGRATNKDGTVSKNKLHRELKIKPVEAQAVIDKMAREGVIEPIGRDKSDNLIYVPVQPDKTLEEAAPTPAEQNLAALQKELAEIRRIKAEQEVVLADMKRKPVSTPREQFNLDTQERLVEELGARERSQENGVNNAQAAVGPKSKPSVQVRANAARSAVSEADQAMPTDEHNRKLNTIANKLRRYLAGLGLADVSLTTTNVLDFAEGTETTGAFIVEGQEEAGVHGKRIITLAMEIYDPNLPDAVLEQRLAGVLNHEIIHSMKALGLFTDAEYQSLVKAAESRKYVKRTGGKKEQRDYTFLDRAEHMYPDLDPEGQQEEAIAEMFRAYADGRLKMAGRPKTLFGRMVQFIKRIFGAYNDAGFKDADAVFEGITSGKVGRRERSRKPYSNYNNDGFKRSVRTFSPDRSIVAYKVVTRGEGDKLFPLFVDAKTEIPMNEWVEAVMPLTYEHNGRLYVPSKGAVNIDGKQKSGTGVLIPIPNEAARQQLLRDGFITKPTATQFLGVAARPGFHAGSLPVANHIGKEIRITPSQVKTLTEAGYGRSIKTGRGGGKVLKIREDDQAWVEVLVPDNSHGTNWQEIAESQAGIYANNAENRRLGRAGQIKNNEADINDRIPFAGHYTYRQGAASKEESWVISGNMLVTRRLSRDEVNRINRENGINDAPTLSEVAEILGDDLPTSIRHGQAGNVKQSRRSDYSRSQDYLTNLKDFIISNPDGFTVTIDGTPTPKVGYAVAPLKQTETKSSAKEFDIDDVLDQVENILRLQQSYKGVGIDIRTYAGGWFNTEEGLYVLDASVILDDKAEALYVASAGDQDAIADLGAINNGDFDNAIIETATGIEGLKSDGVYRDELADVARSNHAKLVEGFEKLRVQDKERREVYTDADVDRVRIDREPDETPAPKLSRRIASISVPNVDSRDVDRISQRLPKGASATQDGVAEYLTLQLDDLLANERQKARAAELIRNYNIITEEEAETLTDDQIIEVLTDRLADNLVFVYDSVDPQTRERSKLWYMGANRIANEIAQKYGVSVSSVAGVMAALSPQMDWYKNVSLAERVIDIKATKMDFKPTKAMERTAQRIYGKEQYQPMLNIIFRQGRNMPLSEYADAPLLEAMFIRIYDETYNDRGYQIVSPDGEDLGYSRTKNGQRSKVGWGSNKEITKAVKAFNDPESVTLEMGARHKVRNFYNNIIAPNSMDGDVTIDTHAVAAAHLKPLSGASTEVHHNFGTAPTPAQQEKLSDWFGGTSNSGPSGVMGTYAIYAEAHRRAAERRGTLPREMQSITWEAVRGLFLPSFKSNAANVQKINDLWDNYRQGLMDIDQVRQEIMNEAGDQGRFRPPSWEGPDSGSLKSPEPPIDEAELSGDVVSRRGPRDYGRVGGEPARGDPRDIDEPNFGDLTEGQIDDLAETRDVFESLPKYSRRSAPAPAILGAPDQEARARTGLPIINRFSTVSAPVRFPDKRFNRYESLFGVIMDGNKPVPVLLFAGEHNNETNGGFGLSHILERNHEIELKENSKFPDIETAIQQTFFAWAKQGHQDGPRVVSSVGTAGGDKARSVDGVFRSMSKKDLVLDWVDPSHKSKAPFRIVLNYGIVSDPDVKAEFGFKNDIPVYSITTAYPVLALKDRANVKQSKRSVTVMPVDYRPPSYRPITAMVEENEEAYQRITYNNVAKVLGNISRKFASDEKADRIQARSERFLTKFQDAMLPIGKMMDELRSDGYSVADGLDTYMREELSHGVIGYKLETNERKLFKPLAETINAINVDQSKIDQLTGGSNPKSIFLSDAIRQDGSQLGIANAYMYALHAKERNRFVQERFGRGLGSGMSDAEADNIVNWVQSLDADNQQALNGVRNYVKQIVASTNEARKDGGLMASEYDFDFYVPLRGNLDPDEEISQDEANLARSYNMRQPDLYGGKRRQDPRITAGRGTSYAEDIIGTVMHQNSTSIVNGERNKVGQSFLKLVQDEKVDTKDFAEVVTDVPDRNKDNVLNVKVNGQLDPVKVFIYDDRIARAMKGAYGEFSNRGGAVVRAMTQLNRYLSSINTTYNPEFLVTNFARDLETAIINVNQYSDIANMDGLAKDITKNVAGSIRGIIDHIRKTNRGEDFDRNNYWSNVYQEFIEKGGRNATNQIDTVEDQVRNIKDVLDSISTNTARGKLGLAKNSFVGKGARSLLQMLDDANTAVENGIRVATYDALIKRNFSEERAAQAARNVTVNFAKAGEDRAMMNAAYLFYNASVQGSFALYNAMIRSPKVRKLWGAMILFGILQDQFLSALSSDEDEDGKKDYDEISDYTLEHNILIDTFGLTDDKYVKIPLGYGINSAVNLGRAISRVQRGEYTVGQASSSIFGTLLESISPIGGVNEFGEIGDYAVTVTPTVLEPGVALLVNRDYDGSPIYKEGSQFGLQKPSSQTHWTTTSGLSKSIATTLNDLTGGSEVTPGAANVSPDVIDYLFSYYTGAAGMFALRTAEAPSKVVDALKEDYEGDITREIPFVRKLFVNPSAFEDVGSFIENRDRVLYAGKELQFARQKGDRAREAQIREEYATELSVYGRLKALNNARNQLMRQKSQIERNPRISEDQKEKLIKRYREKINEIVKKANAVLREAGIK